MAITGVNNTTYTDYDTSTKKSGSESKAEKSYSNSREYKNYLTEKYDCLTSKDYSVTINSSLLQKAASDEKTSEWLEYNLSLIPKAMDKIRSTLAARGSQIVSCNITMNGYDSMTTVLVGRTEADPGTEKARKELEERFKEKKAEEKKKVEKAAEKAAEEERQYKLRVDGKDVADIAWKFTDKVSDSNLGTSTGSSHSAFDVKA